MRFWTEGAEVKCDVAHTSPPFVFAVAPTSTHGGIGMKRVFVGRTASGKVRVLLGAAAEREQRAVARKIDITIDRALWGELEDTDMGELERLANLASRLARG